MSKKITDLFGGVGTVVHIHVHFDYIVEFDIAKSVIEFKR